MLMGFSANSLLCRAALGGGGADALTFTTLRLASGALMLLLLMGKGRVELRSRFHLGRAVALAAYAFGFSVAYRALSAGTGALLLFGAVQATLLSLALLKGEVFPVRKKAGALLAFTGLLVLCLPTAQSPSLGPALAMLGAGAAWGVYTWLGKGATRPLVDTGGAFLGAAALALPLLALASGRLLTITGAMLAVLSGAIASGATYALWYAVVPRLGAVRAAVVQLAVPPLTAFVAVAWLGEVPGPAWFAAAFLTLGGIALAVR